jgi:hypothetical protein
MSDASPVGFPEAARRLGVPVRVLRRAIRAGRIPAPPQPGALAALPADWLARAREAVAASPKALTRAESRKVEPFARYEGTSAWRKYRNRVREYVSFRAAAH